ncbi:MAG: RNA polymerase factor sigma-32 [Alphaproteobacteria bacterium]
MAVTSEVGPAQRKFIEESMRAPLLTRERERELAQAWRDRRDEAALHELIAAYRRLVISKAVRYRRYGLPLADLVQEGLIGLMEAAIRFDPDRDVRFSTYAAWWVRSSIQDFILRNWSIVHSGRTGRYKSLFFSVGRLRAQVGLGEEEPLRPETRHALAQALDVSPERVEELAARLTAADRSLDARISDTGEDAWLDRLADPSPSPEEVVLDKRDGEIRSRWLAAALAELPERERRIIRDRRLSDEPLTLKELGKDLGVSQERVRQIENRALARLRGLLARHARGAGFVPARTA